MSLLRRQPGIAAFTVVQVVGLGAWLGLARGNPQLTQFVTDRVAVDPGLVGLGLLFVALVVEHLLTDATVDDAGVGPPWVGMLLVSATETVLWGAWLAVAEAVGGLLGVGVAGVVLAVLLVPQHTVEDNGLRDRGLFSRLLTLGTVPFSVVEALGASVWLALVVEPSLLAEVEAPADPALVGLAALAALLFVEHNLGVRFARRTVGTQRTRRSRDATADD
jgi:hypothetical protein